MLYNMNLCVKYLLQKHAKFTSIYRPKVRSSPPAAVLKLRLFHSPHICLCLSEETLKGFDLVSMPGEVKDPTQGVNV